MGRLTHLMIHCSDTPAGMWFDGTHIKAWHTDPKPKGRGWRKPGYSDLVLLDGTIENLIPYDEDDWVESWEISNGAAGWNGRTRHICYIGGQTPTEEAERGPLDSRSMPQKAALEIYIKATIRNHPEIKVIGHNQVHTTKYCPSFNVPKWLKEIGIRDENIDFNNYSGNAFFSS